MVDQHAADCSGSKWVVAASFSGPMQSDAAAVAEIACAWLIAMTAWHSD